MKKHNYLDNLEMMSEKELDLAFLTIVLKQECSFSQSIFGVCNGNKQAWQTLKKELMRCHQIVTTKTQVLVNNEVKEKYFVAFILAGNDNPTIASGETQALATVKALILAHAGRYMSAEQLKQLRLAIKKSNGKALTQTEFGTKTGNHTQQSQYDFETGRRPVPSSLAGEAFQLFQKSISSVNTIK